MFNLRYTIAVFLSVPSSVISHRSQFIFNFRPEKEYSTFQFSDLHTNFPLSKSLPCTALNMQLQQKAVHICINTYTTSPSIALLSKNPCLQCLCTLRSVLQAAGDTHSDTPSPTPSQSVEVEPKYSGVIHFSGLSAFIYNHPTLLLVLVLTIAAAPISNPTSTALNHLQRRCTATNAAAIASYRRRWQRRVRSVL